MDYLIRAKQIDILATGIIDAMGLKFFEQAREDRANSEWTARQQRKAQKGLDALDKLAKTADETGFLAGGQPTVTHFSGMFVPCPVSRSIVLTVLH